MKISGWIIVAAGIWFVAGCAHGPRSVSDPDPADKIPAIEVAVHQNDRRAVPQMVTDLDNTDPAIRFYAIDGLRKMTGQDFGYEFYLDDDARKAAVERWKQWLDKQLK